MPYDTAAHRAPHVSLLSAATPLDVRYVLHLSQLSAITFDRPLPEEVIAGPPFSSAPALAPAAAATSQPPSRTSPLPAPPVRVIISLSQPMPDQASTSKTLKFASLDDALSFVSFFPSLPVHIPQ